MSYLHRCVRPLLAGVGVVAVVCSVSQAAPVTYRATLDGPSESPPNASPATGRAWVTIDPVAHTMYVEANFSGLLGTTTAAHIHGPTMFPFEGTASVATQTPSFLNFPLGVTSGSFALLLDTSMTSSFRAGFLAENGGTVEGAEAALFASIEEGRAYFNIHTSVFGGGEIRGFFVPVPLPSPVTMGFAGLGLAMAIRRRR